MNNQLTSVLTLSRRTNYSASYLYTRMKTISNFLSLYGIAVRFSKAGKKLITGSEFQIQYCILDVY
ncbi:helix-turn-helix domain-containing protein [uncultured Enterococcus sp.]|uniref:helix-turn-helix domain-containing protein n=1 Tax=uncultured Enterococcus sp. TaxID=167972 RepID=UPI0037489929